jgi:hypothetical protein
MTVRIDYARRAIEQLEVLYDYIAVAASPASLRATRRPC